MTEQKIEQSFIGKLKELKYTYHPDIMDRASLERNFREKFEAPNRVRLTEGEVARLLDEIVTSDVFTAFTLLKGNRTANRCFRDRHQQILFNDARIRNVFATTLNPFSCN